MDYTTIILENKDHVAKLTLNRPDVLNAINEQMFKEMTHALRAVAEDRDVRVFILTGAGRAFTAATDIKEERGTTDRLLGDLTELEILTYIRDYPQQVTLGLQNMPMPTIAMVNGPAVADGFDWALACDLRIGSEKARFMNAFLQMALVSNTGATWFYPRALGVGKALELLYTGDWLGAEEARELGVLNKLVPADKLEEETMALARKIASKPPSPTASSRRWSTRGSSKTSTSTSLAPPTRKPSPSPPRTTRKPSPPTSPSANPTSPASSPPPAPLFDAPWGRC